MHKKLESQSTLVFQSEHKILHWRCKKYHFDGTEQTRADFPAIFLYTFLIQIDNLSFQAAELKKKKKELVQLSDTKYF